MIILKEYKKILASTSHQTKINKGYFFSDGFLHTIKKAPIEINSRMSKSIREKISK
jgi:hypothetical protein